MSTLDIEGLARRMKEYIETELGLYVEVVHNGRGYSFFPITTTGRIIGETRLMNHYGRYPIMFVTNRGYFTCREGMALASRFRAMIEEELGIDQPQPTLILTPEMRIEDDKSVISIDNVKKMAESLK